MKQLTSAIALLVTLFALPMAAFGQALVHTDGPLAGQPLPTHQHGWWEGKTYTWTDSVGNAHVSNITDKATEAEQIWALLSAIYTDPEVPGQNFHNQYLADGTPCEYQLHPRYINYDWHGANIYKWDNTGVWNEIYPSDSKVQKNPSFYLAKNGLIPLGVESDNNWKDIPWYQIPETNTFRPKNVFDGTRIIKEGGVAIDTIIYPLAYAPWISRDVVDPNGPAGSNLSKIIPNPVEGMTVLMVEISDTWEQSMYDIFEERAEVPLAFIRKSIKSAQVLIENVRIDDPENPGYLFMTKDVSTNRFFFISKGRQRVSDTPRPLTNAAFEIISPRDVQINSEDLLQGHVQRVAHDCYNVIQQGEAPHYVIIDGGSQDERLTGLSLFMPDKRFRGVRYNPATNQLSETYENWTNFSCYIYNTTNGGIFQPGMLLYKALLEAKTEPRGDGYYTITLNWRTHFDRENIGTAVPEQFYVYVFDEATSQYVPLYNFKNSISQILEGDLDEWTTEKTFTFPWPQSNTGPQTFTFLVTANPYEVNDTMTNGRDASNILVNSNTATVVIPGLNDKFSVALADYRSRYALNTENEEYNVYRNRLNLDLVKSDIATKDAYHLYRRNDVEGSSETNNVKIADIKFDRFKICGQWGDAAWETQESASAMTWTDDGKLVIEKYVKNGNEFKLISDKGEWIGAYAEGSYWINESDINSASIQLHEGAGVNLHINGFQGYVTFTFDPQTYKLSLVRSDGQFAHGKTIRYTVSYDAATQKVGTGSAADGDILFDANTDTDLTKVGYTNPFEQISLIDRFTASTATSTHPSGYTYDLRDNDDELVSNVNVVPVWKSYTQAHVNGFTKEQVDADTTHALQEDSQLNVRFDAEIDAKREIEKYEVHRVHGNEYHTQIGKAEYSSYEDNYALIGIDHASGRLTKNLGFYSSADIQDNSTLTVFDDSEYCPDDNPQYVTEIFVGAWDFDTRGHAVNTYGTNIDTTGVPQFTLDTIRVVKSNEIMVGPGRVQTGTGKMKYQAVLRLTPDFTKSENVQTLYKFRIWRVNEDGTETLLNGEADDDSHEDPRYWSNYSALDNDGQFSLTEPLDISDVYIDDKIQPKVTYEETVDGVTSTWDIGGERKVKYIARMYSTSQDMSGTQSTAPRRTLPDDPTDGQHIFYVTEKDIVVPYYDDDRTITAITDVTMPLDQLPISVRYINLQGTVSDRPFDGFNLVVTTYANGRTATKKVVR